MTNINEFTTLVLNGSYKMRITASHAHPLTAGDAVESFDLFGGLATFRLDSALNHAREHLEKNEYAYRIIITIHNGDWERNAAIVDRQGISFC